MNKEKVTSKKEKVIRLVSLLFTLTFLLLPSSAAEKPQAAPHDLVYLGEARPILYRLHIVLDGKPLQAAWDEFVQHVFNELDADKDGVLNRDEAERVPHTSVLFAVNQVGGLALSAPAQIDKDRDGKVTRDELAAYYRSTGAAPFQIQITQSQNSMNNIVFAPDGRRVGAGASGDALNRRLYEVLDTDKDGKLSNEELTAAPAILLRRDADDDETVSNNELQGIATASDYSNVFVTEALGYSQPLNNTFVVVNPGDTLTTLGRQLRDRYALRGKDQANRNPTRESLKLDEATFTQLDVDGNGELDAEELARFAHRPADIELIVRLGKVENGAPTVEIVAARDGANPLAANLKAKSGGATLDLGTTRLDLTTTGSRDAGIRFDVNNKQIYKMQFSRADQDNNGYVDANESRRYPVFQGVFKAMDRDGDGKLFEKEMLAYLDQIEGLQAKAAASCCSLNITDQGKGLFDLLDTNRDGRLSVREMRHAVKLIANLDRDGDQRVGLDEIPRNYQLALRRGGVGSQQFGGRVVVAASPFGMGGSRLPEPTAGPVWFRKMDRNRDGDVSRREFLGTAEEFQRLDADNDGLISAEEAERAKSDAKQESAPRP